MLHNGQGRRSGLDLVVGPIAVGLDHQRHVRASVEDEIAHARGVPVHLDGARIFNAAATLGVPASAIAAEADSVQFCLSKGLAAPVGSMVAGSAEFIGEVRKQRKVLGGAMRQAGVIAAAGLAFVLACRRKARPATQSGASGD